jgi:hypothetical protein
MQIYNNYTPRENVEGIPRQEHHITVPVLQIPHRHGLHSTNNDQK